MGGKETSFYVARRIARQPTIRRAAAPMAAWFFDRRTRGLDRIAIWQAGTKFEVAHWDEQWFARAQRNGLMDPNHPITDTALLRVIAELPSEVDPVRILDVGAGPITPVGKTTPQRRIALTACDALAEDYALSLAARNINPPVRTVYAQGEHLTEVFAPHEFDIIHCGNALDHHFDPWSALMEMLALAPPHGAVLLNHYVNEGEHQRYLGMHRWNIVEENGQLFMWNPQTKINVNERLQDEAEVVAWTDQTFEGDRDRAVAVIRPLVGTSSTRG